MPSQPSVFVILYDCARCVCIAYMYMRFQRPQCKLYCCVCHCLLSPTSSAEPTISFQFPTIDFSYCIIFQILTSANVIAMHAIWQMPALVYVHGIVLMLFLFATWASRACKDCSISFISIGSGCDTLSASLVLRFYCHRTFIYVHNNILPFVSTPACSCVSKKPRST